MVKQSRQMRGRWKRRARAHIELREDEKAEGPLLEALAIHERRDGADGRAYTAIQDELVRLLIRLERLDEATAKIKAERSRKAGLHGEVSLPVAASDFLLGNVLLGEGKIKPAVKRFRLALKSFEKLLGKKHKRTERVQETLDSLVGGGKTARGGRR